MSIIFVTFCWWQVACDINELVAGHAKTSHMTNLTYAPQVCFHTLQPFTGRIRMEPLNYWRLNCWGVWIRKPITRMYDFFHVIYSDNWSLLIDIPSPFAKSQRKQTYLKIGCVCLSFLIWLILCVAVAKLCRMAVCCYTFVKRRLKNGTRQWNSSTCFSVCLDDVLHVTNQRILSWIIIETGTGE